MVSLESFDSGLNLNIRGWSRGKVGNRKDLAVIKEIYD